MIEVERSAAGAEATYLEGLNASFGRWGGMERYRWAFERAAGGPAADLMMLREGGELLAGSAVTYRRARVPGAGERLVGIMTGSWTLPPARGRGCFTRVIEESLTLCRDRGAALLLAFVTEDNASRRRLEAAGSVMIPTEYWIAEQWTVPADPGDAVTLEVASPDAGELRGLHEVLPGEGIRITYPDAAAYAGQFLERPESVEVLTGPHGTAIMERAAGADRILALYGEDGARARLLRALAARTWRDGQTLVGFTTGGAPAEAYRALGLVPRAGYLTALPADALLDDAWSRSGASLENGDRM
jgi:hypothetical protein